MLPQKTINGITLNIRHTMLPVSDMERTVDFYTRLLGMDVQRIRDVPARNERVRYLGYGNEDEGPYSSSSNPPRLAEKRPWRGGPATSRFTSRIVTSSAKSSKPKGWNLSAVRRRTGPAARISTPSSKTRTVTSSS